MNDTTEANVDRQSGPVEAPIHGHCAPGFETVRAAFAQNFATDGELGAALHVIIHGEVVVDLWGGWTDDGRTDEWRADTLVDMYSAGKALLSLLVLQLVDRGELRLDDTVASVWPEFAAGGKETATIEHVLTHRAGVPAIREPLTDEDLFDWNRMTNAIAATEAWWHPGERLAYHVNTYGHILGELVRRVTDEMPGPALRRMAGPLGAEVFFGVPADQQARCADVIWAPSKPIFRPARFEDLAGLQGDQLMNALAHLNPPGYSSIGLMNTARWRSLQLGSTAGHATAAGLARIYASVLDDKLISRGLRDIASSVRVSEHCPILDDEFVYGLGFQPTTPRRPLGPNAHSFGHFGTGGSLGFADPDTGIAFGYVMNHVVPRWQSTRNRRLADAVYACL